MLSLSFRELKWQWEGKVMHDWDIASTLAANLLQPHTKDTVRPHSLNPMVVDNYGTTFTPQAVSAIAKMWLSQHKG